jgi:hypothetical protein
MTYSTPFNPETDSSRPGGEYLPEHFARVDVLTDGLREALYSLKDAGKTQRPAARQEDVAPAITSLATAQTVEAVVDPVVARVDAMTDEEREQEARDMLAQVWAGMDGPDEISLSPQLLSLDTGFLERMEQEV